LPFDSAIALPERSDVGMPTSINKDPRIIKHYLEERERYQPDLRKGRLAALASNGAFLDTEVYSYDERLNLPFFAEIIRPQGITSQLVAHVRFQNRMTCVLHLCRHDRRVPFRPRDRERLMPVLAGIAVAHAAFDGAAATAAARIAPAAAEPTELGTFRELFQTLSPREREIARYVAYGYRNRDIALALGTSPHTVRNHLYQVFSKLGTNHRTELALWMERAGFAIQP
jgi:DNA-binding CsgD family transcriptional regulator